MKDFSRIVCFIGILLCCALARSLSLVQPPIHKLSDSLVDPGGLTVTGDFSGSMNAVTFHQDAHISHRGWQYISFYDASRYVCIARRQLPAGAWETIRFTDFVYPGSDTHQIIALGICPGDGTIHLSFAQQRTPLKYRFSQKNVANEPEKFAWDASLFSSIQDKLATQSIPQVTYPRFIQTPEGALQYSYSAAGPRHFYEYDPNTSSWTYVCQLAAGALSGNIGPYVDVYGTCTTRISYPNDYAYDTSGRLHATWTWREWKWSVNHDIIYACSDDRGRTWHNGLGTSFTLPINVNTTGSLAVAISTRYGMINDQAQAVDSHGRVHVVMSHSQLENTDTTTITKISWASPGGARYFHYWRDPSGVWNKFMLDWPSGNRPKVYADKDDNLYLIYQRANYLRIARATAAAEWKDWQVIHSETGPFINEMLADRVRWKEDGILSVLVQEKPPTMGQPSALRILEFGFGPPSSSQYWELY